MNAAIEQFRKNFINPGKREPIAIYGIGRDTEAIINAFSDYPIFCLMDEAMKEGTVYGKPVCDINKLPDSIKTIVIVARKASEAVVFRRIKTFCRVHFINVTNVKGENLFSLYGRDELPERIDLALIKKEIDRHDFISFDIFGTLIYRRFGERSYIYRHIEKIISPGFDFSRERLLAERLLSKDGVPDIDGIYKEIGLRTGASDELLQRLLDEELRLEGENLTVSPLMREAFRYCIELEKPVYLISDMYFPGTVLEQFLQNAGIVGYSKLFVSCEYGKEKRNGLFDIYKEETKGSNNLHIGDDPEADIDAAREAGVDALLFASEHCVMDQVEFGYKFLGPVLTAFSYWILERALENNIGLLFFISRDGFVVKKIYDMIARKESCPRSEYLLTSRSASVLSYIRTRSDIEFAVSLPFSGSRSELLKKRFGLAEDEIEGREADIDSEDWLDHFEREILLHAAQAEKNYSTYLSGVKRSDDKGCAIVDFVSSGTNQLCLERLLGTRLLGLYFEAVNDGRALKNALEIKGFREERGSGNGFEYFYVEPLIKEAVPSLMGFDGCGSPVYSKEAISPEDKEMILKVQEGILKYASEYFEMIGDSPDSAFVEEALDRLRYVNGSSVQIAVRDVFTNRTG